MRTGLFSAGQTTIRQFLPIREISTFITNVQRKSSLSARIVVSVTISRKKHKQRNEITYGNQESNMKRVQSGDTVE